VAQERAGAGGQQGGDEVSFLGEQFGPYGRVHARVQAMQPARSQGAVHRGPADAGGEQLRAADDADPRRMTKDFETPDHPNGMEAELAVRKAGREASSQADGLADRLAEIDHHQREARYLLERAGMLERRRQRQ
jgi:hypothetical protein